MVEQESTIIQENIEDFYNQQFNFISKIDFFKEKDVCLIFHLGGLVNFTLYQQQKYFRTGGVLKRITPYLNYIDYIKTKDIIELCNHLQKAVSKKEHKRYSFITKLVNEQFDKINEGDFKSTQEDLIFSFITGYNFYNQCWNFINLKGKNDSISFDKFLPPLEYYKEQFPEYKDLLLRKRIKNNNSLKLGILVGFYFFRTAIDQIWELKTKSLVKSINPLLKKIDLSVLKKLLKDIGIVVIKLSIIEQNRNESNSNIMFLKYSDLHLNIFYLLEYQKLEFNSKNFIIGLWSALTLMDLGMKKKSKITDHGNKDETNEPELKNLNEIEKIDDDLELKNKRYIDVNKYLEYIKNNCSSDINSQFSFIIGIFLNLMTYQERTLLGTNRLKKVSSFIIRHLNTNNLEHLMTEIIKVYIACWLNQKSKSARIFSLIPEIRLKLIQLFGEQLNKSYPEPDNLINLIKGYHCPRVLSWEKKENEKNKKGE
ncbi:MAG: hypothetical protein ACTSYY_02140 [Promethearchaeota archaeon]